WPPVRESLPELIGNSPDKGRMMKVAGTLFVSFLWLLLTTGCERPSANPAAATAAKSSGVEESAALSRKPPADWSANEILAHLLRTHRNAKTYQDQGVVRLEFRQRGQPVKL